MSAHKEDARSKKIIFVSNCLLNSNNKVKEFARYPGLCKEVVDAIYKYDLGIMQMPCPETLYLGIDRWWCTKNLYDNAGFREFCRGLAKQMVDYMENYQKAGYETVAILSSNGSPTCGVTLTSWSEDWGGRPKEVDNDGTLVQGAGVYIEELGKEILARNVAMPPMYGLNLDEVSKPLEEIIAEFEAFIDDLCK
ncbi:MAG: CD3072 family TudS-related putative desulfidase [Eubacteriales bacterium]